MTASRFIIKVLWVVGLLLCLSSCKLFQHSASWHINQAKAKDPSLFKSTNDTTKVAVGSFDLDCDSLLNALKNLPSVDEENNEGWIDMFIDTPITDSDGNTREDSARIRIKPKTVYRDRVLTREDSLKVLNGMLTAEDSARIFKTLLEIGVDCPDCICEDTIITIKPTFWEKAQWGLYLLIVLAVMAFLRRIFFRKT